MVNKVLSYEERTKIMIASPLIKGEKGTHKDTLEHLRKEGFIRVKIDGEMHDLIDEIELDKNKKHDINVIVDRLIIKDSIRSRLYERGRRGGKGVGNAQRQALDQGL